MSAHPVQPASLPAARDGAALVGLSGFVRTPTALAVETLLHRAQSLPDIVLIHSGAGTGKTWTAKRYCEETRRAWLVTMTPATSEKVPMLRAIAEAVGVQRENFGGEQFRAIVQRLAPAWQPSPTLLIVDEAQNLQADALELLRALHDEARCGLALIGERRAFARLADKGDAADLDGLRGRIGKTLGLGAPSAEDVKAFADAMDVQSGTTRDALARVAAHAGGLRGIAKAVRMAQLASAGRAVTEAHLRAACTDLLAG